jgi:hypothetical protein
LLCDAIHRCAGIPFRKISDQEDTLSSYCDYCNTHPEDTFNKNYHDNEYGFPLKEDDQLFERLVLEINQAGLSWYPELRKNYSISYCDSS